MNLKNIAIIGLDSSHTHEFSKIIVSNPDLGMKAISCMRFPTSFMDDNDLDPREVLMSSLGIKVTRDFDEAVDGCDGIMLIINDPALHLKYFEICAKANKPIFVDKPLADTLENGKRIYEIAQENNIPIYSASSLRYGTSLEDACEKMPSPMCVSSCGPIGKAPSGSSIVWYGVHAFEMLQRAIGVGAVGVKVSSNRDEMIISVEYNDGRYGLVELNPNSYAYCGTLRDKDIAAPFAIDFNDVYYRQNKVLGEFFQTCQSPVSMQETMEIMSLLDATERSWESKKFELVLH